MIILINIKQIGGYHLLMRMYDIILKKRNKIALSKSEIRYLVEGYTNGSIPDYQMSAFLMAVCFQGMNEEETTELTMAMAESGDTLDLSAIHGKKADKHSTGGVGDKTSLIVAPMVAALNVPVAKMSGRGLGHTGGTIDKLESFPGFSVNLSEEQFIQNVNQIKLAINGQTKNLAPADKKLYALRDVTGTVDSLPLIASSIMSKKLAAGADVIVLDVKTGSGAFMKNLEDSIALAKMMVKIGTMAKKVTYAVISDMSQPLGEMVGNALEVGEAIAVLNGKGKEDILEASLVLGSYMLLGTGTVTNIEQAREKLLGTIKDGSALKKFAEFVKAQGGDEKAVYDTSLLPKASIVEEICADKSGYIQAIDTKEIGIACFILGGGREKKEDKIDLSVGFCNYKKIGDFVAKGDIIAKFYANDRKKLEQAKQRYLNAYQFSSNNVTAPKHIYGIVTIDGFKEFNITKETSHFNAAQI